MIGKPIREAALPERLRLAQNRERTYITYFSFSGAIVRSLQPRPILSGRNELASHWLYSKTRNVREAYSTSHWKQGWRGDVRSYVGTGRASAVEAARTLRYPGRALRDSRPRAAT